MLSSDKNTHTSCRIANEVRHRSDSLNNANHPSAQSRTGGQDDASGSSSVLKKSGTGTVPGPAPAGAGKPGRNGPLGIYPKSLDQLSDEEKRKGKENKRLESRRQLYADLKTSALILRDENPRKLHAVSKCRWTKIGGEVSLNLMNVGENQVRAAFKGVKICGNVWGCPVCSARISQTRRGEMNTLLAWSRENRFFPVMLTLTTRHGRDDRLSDMLERMKRAKERLRQRREWRQLPFVGSVTATEITHGVRHGWHPHFHEIIILEASSEEEALELVKPLGDAWRASLRGQGLDGAEAAFDAQGAGSAGDYVAKWGAAEEVTLSNSKTGKKSKAGKGRSPRELVRMAGSGDAETRELWLEYFKATSGRRRRQLVWSRGLKDLCGLTEVTDEDAATVEEAEKEQELRSWDNEGWRRVRTKRVRLMEAGERGGRDAVRQAESGPDDDQQDLSGEVIEKDGSEPERAENRLTQKDTSIRLQTVKRRVCLGNVFYEDFDAGACRGLDGQLCSREDCEV